MDQYVISEGNGRSLNAGHDTGARHVHDNYNIIMQHKFKRNQNSLESTEGPSLRKNLSSRIQRRPGNSQATTQRALVGLDQSLVADDSHGKLAASISQAFDGGLDENRIQSGEAYQVPIVKHELPQTKMVKKSRRALE